METDTTPVTVKPSYTLWQLILYMLRRASSTSRLYVSRSGRASRLDLYQLRWLVVDTRAIHYCRCSPYWADRLSVDVSLKRSI